MTTATKKSLGLLILFILLALIWGATFSVTKVVGDTIPSLQGSSLRVLLAIVLLQLLFWIKRNPQKEATRLPRKCLPAAWLSGILLMALPYILIFVGMRTIAPGLGGLMEGTIPLFVFLLALGSRKSRGALNPKAAGGLMVGLSGLLLVFADKIEFHGQPKELLGMGFMLLEVIAVAMGSLINRRLVSTHKLNIHALLYQQTLASLFFLLPLTLAIDGVPSWSAITSSWQVIVGIVFLGIFPTALANYIYTLLTREWGTVRAAAVGYFIPVAALLLDYLFFGNIPTSLEILGGITILLGVAILQPQAIVAKFLLQWRKVWKACRQRGFVPAPTFNLSKAA